MSGEKENTESNNADIVMNTRKRILIHLKSVLDRLDESSWKEKYESDLDTVEESHNLLAVRYYEVTNSAVKGLVILLTCLIIIDLLVEMNSLVYGLTVNLWGSIFLIYPSFRGKYMISSISESVDEQAIREIEVNRMVFTNIGFFLLILGFLLQIIAHQVFSYGFITTNILSIYLSEWTVVPLTLVALIISIEKMA